MGFEFADDAAFDMLDCNTLSSGDADVINTTLALIEPCLDDLNVLANIGSEPIAKLAVLKPWRHSQALTTLPCGTACS